MMQNPRMRRMAVPLNIPRKRSNTGLIIGTVVFFILVGIGVVVLIWYLNSDCYARDEIDAECSDDDKCCKESKLKCELNKCCGNIGFKCSNNDECCDLNCDGGSCKKPEVECTKKDNECSDNDDCCDDLNCNSDNICADCKLKNVSCSDSNECCNENCSGGKCYEETQPGAQPPETPPPEPPPPIKCLEGSELDDNNPGYCNSMLGQCRGVNNSDVKSLFYDSDCNLSPDCIGYSVFVNDNHYCFLYGANLNTDSGVYSNTNYTELVKGTSDTITGTDGDNTIKCVLKN